MLKRFDLSNSGACALRNLTMFAWVKCAGDAGCDLRYIVSPTLRQRVQLAPQRLR